MSILRKGQSLQWENGEILIEELLGGGMTAEVYRATLGSSGEKVEVALKYLRPGASREVEKLFFAEPENLQRVYQAWEAARGNEGLLGQLVRRFPFPAPRLLGESKSPPFILMDIIHGMPLDEFLASYRSEHSIVEWEPLVLTLGVHLGALLWVLHDYARRCYSDMKIGNFWWVGSEDSPALVLTDWNVLNELTNEWVQRDLFLATLMLYTWLTGDTLPRQRLQITVPLGTLPSFQILSRGVKQFLRRALSPTLKIRYASAQEWTTALWDALGWWHIGDEALMETLEQEIAAIRELEAKIQSQESQGALDRNLIVEQAQLYQKFGVILDIASLRGLASDAQQDLYQEYVERLSPLGIGKRALQGLSFDLAMEQFERGASLFPEDAVAYRHWWTAADGAKHLPMGVFRKIRDKVLQAVEKANEGRWREAKSLLDEAGVAIFDDNLEAWQMFLERLAKGERETSSDMLRNGIVLLGVEAQAVLLEQESRSALQRGDYERAENLALRARNLADLLPRDAQHIWYIQSSEVAALQDEIVHHKESAAKESELWGVVRSARENGAWERAMDALRNAWDWLPDQREVVLKEWEETARRMWVKDEVESLRTLVHRLIPLLNGSDTFKKFLPLQGTVTLLYQLGATREKGFIGVEWRTIEDWWRSALNSARQLQWGFQPLLSEAKLWEEEVLEKGMWKEWARLIGVWESVAWKEWLEEVSRLRQRADAYIYSLLEGKVQTLEKLAAVLTGEMPLLIDLAEKELLGLQSSLRMVGGKEGNLEKRLQMVSRRIHEAQALQSQKISVTKQHYEDAWRVIEQALSLGRAQPGELSLAALIDAVGALRAMGAREIPAEVSNTTAYYQAFVAHNKQIEGNTALERLHNWFFYLWLRSTDKELWQDWLTLLKQRGGVSPHAWESVYWWANRLLSHLPDSSGGSEEIRRALQEAIEEALETLDFVHYLEERGVYQTEPSQQTS